jgi:pimeloyl-ACP methyl ester carboxylesterase/uncharacterized Zn-binding protein involved in type VI secretion
MLLVVVALFTVHEAFAAADIPLFGPKRYERTQGKPPLYTDTFTGCTAAGAQAVVRVKNGSSTASSLTSAVIALNGAAVFSETDFKNQTQMLEKVVPFFPGVNTLSAQLKSSGQQEIPFLEIEVLGRGCDITPPVISGLQPADGALLNTAHPIIAASYADNPGGSGIDTSSVRVVLDGSDITSACTAGGTGVSCPPASNLVDGLHIVTLAVSDLAKNPAALSWRFAIDTVPPQLSVSTLSDGSYTNNETLNISGTVTDAGGLGKLLINGVVVPVNPDASYSYPLILKTGANVVTIETIDKAANKSSNSRTINLDQTAPQLVIKTPADNSKTGVQRIGITGTVDEQATVEVKLKDTVQQAVMTGNSFIATVIPEYGYNTIEITARDRAGNLSSQKRTVIFDNKKPSVAITDPAQDLRTNKGSLAIKGTATDADSLTAVSVTLTKDGETFTPPVVNGAYEQVVTFKEEKSYAIVVTAADEAGNSTSVQRSVIYDTTPPVITVTAPLADVFLGTPQITVSGSVNEPVTAVTVNGVAASLSGNSFTAAITLVEGANIIIVSAVDLATNSGVATVPVNLDTVPPAITITTPAPGLLTKTAQVTVSGTVSEPVVSITINGQPATVNGLTFTSTLSLVEGFNTLEIKAIDRAGNSGTASVAVNLDSTPPAPPVLAPQKTPVNVAAITITGTAEAGSTVKITAGATVIGTVIADPQGSFILPGVTMAEGNNSYSATATDAAGNESLPSAPLVTVLDTKPPVITVTAPQTGVVINTPDVTITGSVNEPLASLTINGAAVTLDPSLAFTTTMALAAGSNSALIVAIDPAGNVATTTLTIMRDSTPPVVTITSPANGFLTRTSAIQVTGTVDDSEATLTVNGAAVISSNKTFNFTYILSEGENSINVEATDKAGNKGSASTTVTLDATVPQITVSAPLTATAGTDVQLVISATDNRGLSLVDLTADGASLWSAAPNGALAAGQSLSYRLSPALSAGATVTVQGRGGDAAGNSANATAIITIDKAADGPGWLQGKVLDDSRGLTLEGAKVRVIDTNGGQQEIITPADGSWFCELPSGLARVEISKSGYTIVNRDVTVRPGQRTTVLDSRLTAIDGTARLIGTTGSTIKVPVGAGLVPAQSIDITIPANALSTSADLRLTTLSNQGLIAQLPSGWSPVAALELRLLEPQPLTAPATITLPLPKGLGDSPQNAILAGYDTNRRQWLSVAEVAIAANATTAITQIPKLGQYALLLGDPAPNAPVAPAVGSELTTAPLAAIDFSQTSTTGRVVPQASLPKAGLKAAGDLLLTAKTDAATPPLLVSGVMVNANVAEKFDMKTGDSIQPASSTQNIILYRYPCVTNIGFGATEPFDPAAGLRTTFPVAPSRDFTIVDLLKGKLSITITPLETAGGVMVGADGARLLQPDGTGLVIPAGALTSSVPVTIATLPEANVTSLIGSDFRLLRAIDLTVTGQTLKTGATLSIPAPQGIDQTLPIIVARKFDTNGVSRLKLIALATQSGTLISSTPLSPELGSSTNSINSSGTYLFLQATAPIGYVTGQVTDSANAPFPGILTTVAGATLSDKTAIDGRYLIALTSGEKTVTALDQARGDFATATATITADSKTVLDLKVVMIPPTVKAITPTNGAVKVQPDVPVTVTFSKAMDKTTITSATLVVRDAANSAVAGALTYSVDSKTVTFYPNEQFKQETTYTVSIGATVKDLQGYPLGQDVVSAFTVRRTTPPVMPAAGNISGTFPDADGFITVTATQGSADPANTVLLINDTTGEITSVKPATNGSFAGRTRAQLGDEIKVVIMDYSGNQTLVSYITFKSDDGKYLVTAKGGKVEGEGGSILDIPEGALVGPAIIKVTAIQEINLPSPVPDKGKFLAAFNLDTGGIGFQKEVHLSIPVPDGHKPETAVFVTKPGALVNGDGTIEQVYEIIDSTKIVNGRITTASPPFDGIMGIGSYVFTAFPEVQLGVVSGYAYQNMNDQPGYQEAPSRAAWDELMPGTLASDQKYKYDRPVQGAVIRTPAAWNYVSYSKSTGFYAGFTTLYANVGVTDLEYKLAAIHPQTMRRENVTGYLSADGTMSYNIKNINFKLADKDTVVPDKAAPIITIDMQVAPGQPPETRIIAGTVLVGTEIQVPISILDQQMGSATLTVTFTDPTSNEPYPVVVRQNGLPTLFTPQTGAKPAIWRYAFTPEFQSPIAAANPANFRPNRVGIYSFLVEATDSAGNKSRQIMQLRTVSADTSLGVSKDGPPTVDSLTPSDKAKDIMVSIPITAVFSEPVTNVTSNTFRLIDLTASRAPGVTVEIAVPATVTTGLVNGRMQAVLTPRNNLYYDRDYQIVLTGEIKDLPDKNDSATTADKCFPLAEVRTTFSTKKPTSYDLTDNLFSGRDIDLYFNRETMKLYSYVTAGDQGWRVVEVTNPTSPQLLWPRPDLGIPSVGFKFPAGFDYRSLAVHPDPNNPLLGMTENINFADGNQYGYVRFYSLANPALPELVGREKLAEAYSGIPGRLALFGDYAFVATINAGLQVVSIAQTKANLTDNKPSDGSSIVGVFDSIGQGLGQPSDILVLNGVNALLTTTSGSLATLDITEPSFPMLVTSIGKDDGRRYTRIAAAVQYQYMDDNNISRNMDLVLAASQDGKIRTIDMSNPASPQVLTAALNETETGEASIAARDLVINKESGLAFVTGLDTIYVLDIKNPYKPKVINRYTSLYDPTGARDATGALLTIPVGQIPAIVERGGWIYAANQQKGVKILNFDPPTIVPSPGRYFVLLDENDAAQQPYQFSFHITTDPGTEGDFDNMRIILQKDYHEIKRFMDIKPDTPMTLIETGMNFDLNSTYQALVIVYDKNTKNDVYSPVIPIVAGKFEMSDEDDRYKKLRGAATDGTARLKLELKVTKNYKSYKPVFSLEDPALGTDTNATGLMLYQGGWTGAFVAQFDETTQSFKATYRVPQTYVRYGTSMEATDKEGAERVVNVDLGITDIKPVIKLRRPPVVLVHGLWAYPDSWDTFEPELDKYDQYQIVRADYGATNAEAITYNYEKAEERIDFASEKMTASGFYSPKVNVIGHSMGGLLTREYCRVNSSECKEKINRFISIDTPHKGSELASEVQLINAEKPTTCFPLLQVLESKNKKIWADSKLRTDLAGALIDLQISSVALTYLNNSTMPVSWTSIAGVTLGGVKAYDYDIEQLWKGLFFYCSKVPDSSFFTLPGFISKVFYETNDRIVSKSSQFGDAPETYQIPLVDHSSVLKVKGTVDKVKDIIER